jgi:chemotaxis-related protein WspD
VNVRGEILLCVALNVLLGIESSRGRAGQAAHELRGRILVCDRNGDRMAFVVDEVYGVHRYQPTELKQLPATAAKSASTYALGLVPWKSNQAIACLDDELVFYALNKGLV